MEVNILGLESCDEGALGDRFAGNDEDVKSAKSIRDDDVNDVDGVVIDDEDDGNDCIDDKDDDDAV